MFLPPLGRARRKFDLVRPCDVMWHQARRKLQVQESAEEYQAIFQPFRIELSITLARSLLTLAFGSWCFCRTRNLLTTSGSGTPKRQSLTVLAMLLQLAVEVQRQSLTAMA